MFIVCLITEHSLQYLLVCLQEPKLATSAAKAVQDICSTCPGQMEHHFNGLLQIVQSIDSINLSNYVALELLQGTSDVTNQSSSLF